MTREMSDCVVVEDHPSSTEEGGKGGEGSEEVQ